jgi:hypothetical protein
MISVNKDIERLIVRRLDGALTEDEELRLNRELIRNPEARQLLEDYERVDALASAALTDVLGGEQEDVDVSLLTERAPTPSRQVGHRRGWWLVPGAVAAALLALAIPRISFDGAGPSQPSFKQPLVVDGSSDNRVDPAGVNRPSIGQVGSTPLPRRGRDSLSRNVSQLPMTSRQTGRDVLGVMGDDGNIYWIETDRTRTIRQTPARHLLGSSDEL